jgi:hypothetical protein
METCIESRNKRKTRKKPTPHVDLEQPTIIERDGKIIIHIPMVFKRRGGRKEIILPPGCKLNDDENGPSINKSLAVAVALGHRWLDLLTERRFGSVQELSEAIGMDPSQMRRHLNLACLPPKLVLEILDGREKEGLLMEELQKVSHSWEEQEEQWIT